MMNGRTMPRGVGRNGRRWIVRRRHLGILFAAAMVCHGPDLFAQTPLLSPRDSVEATFNGHRIFIDYGRPSKRGRVIMGGLVPFNRWWRTGANEATSFRTDVDLLLGDSLVPAGSYTLYTLPSEHRWLLIINRETGQWGTVYNPERDLVRIPMRKRAMENVLEKFTITLERAGPASGVLRLRWERTDVSVPFKIVQLRSADAEGSKG